LLVGWPDEVPGCSALPEVHAGLHLSVRCESLARERELIAAAATVGVEINPLSVQWLPEGRTSADQRAGLVMGFAAVPERAIGEALQALLQAWKLPG
jgi:GntR family transcriptional regulator/MocR family aminotransferase